MERVLELHSFFRRQAARELDVANMNRLYWNDTLAARAQSRIRCSSWRQRRRARLGSNVNVGKLRNSRRRSVDRLFSKWFSQQVYFSHTSQFQGCSPWDSCLQFRAMINARHHSVGCAELSNCGRRRKYAVLLCFYEGGSPNEDTFDFLYGSTCTKCDSPLSFCEDGLCATCDHTDSLCECRKSCHKEGVGQGRLNSTSCMCDCDYGMGPNCDEPCRNPPNLIGVDVCKTAGADQEASDGGSNTEPLDCERFGRYCPEQCSCTPWPGQSALSGADDYSNVDVIYAEQNYDYDGHNAGDYDVDDAVIYFM